MLAKHRLRALSFRDLCFPPLRSSTQISDAFTTPKTFGSSHIVDAIPSDRQHNATRDESREIVLNADNVKPMRIQVSMRRSQFQRVGGQSLNKGRCPLCFPRYQQNRPSSTGILNLSPRRFASPPCYPTNCFNYDGSLVNSPTRFTCRATKHGKKGEKKKKKQTRDERWREIERERRRIGEEKEEGSTIIMNRVRERVYPQPVPPSSHCNVRFARIMTSTFESRVT